jgi:hypothetical protein
MMVVRDRRFLEVILCQKYNAIPPELALMTLWRWDHDPELAELGWEPPVKIRKRNYRRRRPLEKFKVALRNFGITALRGVPRSNGARPARDAYVAREKLRQMIADGLSSPKRGRRR